MKYSVTPSEGISSYIYLRASLLTCRDRPSPIFPLHPKKETPRPCLHIRNIQLVIFPPFPFFIFMFFHFIKVTRNS